MGNGEWHCWLVKGLEREMLEDLRQGGLVRRHRDGSMEVDA